MNDVELLAHVAGLEGELMQPAVRRNAQRVQSLLHPEAQEVGRSGRCYDRAALLALLTATPPDNEIARTEGFALQRLGAELVLLRYRSRRGECGTERSSLWQWHEGAWRLRFHQGTPSS